MLTSMCRPRPVCPRSKSAAKTSMAAAYDPAVGHVVTGWMLLLAVLAVPCIAVGIGLLKFRPWARSFGAILAIFQLLNFPLGTALGIFALWALMSQEADQLFTPRFRVR